MNCGGDGRMEAKLSGLNHVTPQIMTTNRDAAVVTFTAGAILNALFGKVLKRIIKEVCMRCCVGVRVVMWTDLTQPPFKHSTT